MCSLNACAAADRFNRPPGPWQALKDRLSTAGVIGRRVAAGLKHDDGQAQDYRPNLAQDGRKLLSVR